jgi:hypothetical protein
MIGRAAMNDEQDFIGEIIESSTTEFTAESRELYYPPAFGSFVKVELRLPETLIGIPPIAQQVIAETEDDPFAETAFRQSAGGFGREYDRAMNGEVVADSSGVPSLTIYAVVHNATTGAPDSTRLPRAYWKDEERLREEQPEISEWMLVTRFQAMIVAHASNGSIRQFLPPMPPKIHGGVLPCTADEICKLTARMDFLRTVVNFADAPTEEVVAACIREAHYARGGDFQFLVSAGKELAGLLKDDYDRLQAIMRRVSV